MDRGIYPRQLLVYTDLPTTNGSRRRGAASCSDVYFPSCGQGMDVPVAFGYFQPVYRLDTAHSMEELEGNPNIAARMSRAVEAIERPSTYRPDIEAD